MVRDAHSDRVIGEAIKERRERERKAEERTTGEPACATQPIRVSEAEARQPGPSKRDQFYSLRERWRALMREQLRLQEQINEFCGQPWSWNGGDLCQVTVEELSWPELIAAAGASERFSSDRAQILAQEMQRRISSGQLGRRVSDPAEGEAQS